jgi:hypothetical protein
MDGGRSTPRPALGGCAETMGALLELAGGGHTRRGRIWTHSPALHLYATSSGAVQSLLEAGADLHRRDTSGSIRLCFKQPSTAMLRR